MVLGGWQPPQYLLELVVAWVPGLKGSPDNWLKGLSLLTLLGPPANASRVIKSFLEPSLANAATGCRETPFPPSLHPLHDRGCGVTVAKARTWLSEGSCTAAARHIHLTPSSKKLPSPKGGREVSLNKCGENRKGGSSFGTRRSRIIGRSFDSITWMDLPREKRGYLFYFRKDRRSLSLSLSLSFARNIGSTVDKLSRANGPSEERHSREIKSNRSKRASFRMNNELSASE